MGFRFKGEPLQKQYIRALPSSSTSRGMIGSSDVETLVGASTVGANQFGLWLGTTYDIAKANGIVGIVTAVPTATTADSTTPFYFAPITPYDIIEADWSTNPIKTAGANLLVSSNIGYYFGVSNTTTIAGGINIDASVAGIAPGTTNCLFFKLIDYTTIEKKVWGTINSSHLFFS